MGQGRTEGEEPESGWLMPTVACVLRSSPDFTPEYVVRLWDAVRKHWTGNLRFLCLTDTPIGESGIDEIQLKHDWPGYWSKLEVFRPDITGDLLYFDLDTLVVGSLSDIQAVSHHTMLRSFRWKHRLASGLMYLPEDVRPVIWDEWNKAPGRWMKEHRWGKANGRLPGDQGFMQEVWERFGWGPGKCPTPEWSRRGIGRWQATVPGQVLSYKYHLRKHPFGYPDARVICFHGSPRPHELGWEL